MTWVLAFALPAFFVETFVHETAHAVVALFQSMTIKSFKVWPHFVDHDNNPATREWFFWGRVVYGKGKDFVDVPMERATRCWAPIYAGLVIWSVLLGVVNELGEFQWYDWALSTYFAAVCLDLQTNLLKPLWRTKRGDLNKGAKAIGMPRWATVLVGTVAGLAVLAGTVLVLWKALPL